MFNQSFQSYFYSLIAWNNYYDDNTTVEAMLAAAPVSMSAPDAATVYADPQYGMVTFKALTYWVAASLAAREAADGSGAGTDQYKVIQAHFLAADSITITDAQMDGIVGTGSEMLSQITTLEGKLVNNPTLTKYDDLTEPVSAQKLAMV